MADLNELNEKVEQIKADIREQLEKIENTKGVYEYKKTILDKNGIIGGLFEKGGSYQYHYTTFPLHTLDAVDDSLGAVLDKKQIINNK